MIKLINLVKQRFCSHKYSLLTSYKKDTDTGVGYNRQELFIVYCPNCNHQIEVLKHEYDTIMQRQKIDEEFVN